MPAPAERSGGEAERTPPSTGPTCLNGKVKASLDPPGSPADSRLPRPASRPRPSAAATLTIASPSDPAEREASEVADRIVRGLPLRRERLEARRGGL
ncbi:MAG: hypothetical protein KC486_17660, partial [Myxococcales bacterium]|nr:hypothetical protein [Myxococcales bacterium]